MADDIAVLAAHIDAATQKLLTQIRAFDSASGWYHLGAMSCAHWLSWRIGMGLGAAREKVRVAHKLAELPLIDAAFAAGELSYSKVRAMTRVATADNEETLLIMARASTAAQLEKICRLYRGVVRREQPAALAEQCARFVRSRDTDDGMVAIELRLLPEEAASFLKAVERCTDGGTQADGAVHLAEAALLGDGAGNSAKPARPPVEVVVHPIGAVVPVREKAVKSDWLTVLKVIPSYLSGRWVGALGDLDALGRIIQGFVGVDHVVAIALCLKGWR